MAKVLAALVVLAVLELAVIVTIGRAIGAGWTLLALATFGVLGVFLVQRQGLGVLRRAWQAAAAGGSVGRELAEGALIVVGGILIVLPGFLTDVVGLLLLVPPARSVVRRVLGAWVVARLGLRRAGRRGTTGRPPGVGPGSVIDL